LAAYAQGARAYLIDTVAGTIPNQNGIPAISALLDGSWLASGGDGTIYVSDSKSGIRKITPDGIIADVYPSVPPAGLAVDSYGTLYWIGGPELYIRSADSGEVTALRPDIGPIHPTNFSAVAADSNGVVYVADPKVPVVLRVFPDKTVQNFAGFGSTTKLTGPPSRLAVDAQNNVYIVQLDNRVVRVSPGGAPTLIAGNGTTGAPAIGGDATQSPFLSLGAIAVNAASEVFVYDSLVQAIFKINTQGVVETAAADVSVSDITTDANGNLLFLASGKITRVESDGSRTVIAGADRFGGDGGPAVEALLQFPTAVAVDSGGTLIISDRWNNRIRAVTPEGIINTIAGTGVPGWDGDGGPAALAQLDHPDQFVMDGQGNLYFSSGVRVRRLNVDGTIDTVAGSGGYGTTGDGGPALLATFNSVSGIALDRNGSVFISDRYANTVRVVTTDGTINRYAGTGEYASGDDGAPAIETALSRPALLLTDADGNLVILEAGLSRLRKVSADTGILTSVTGTGQFGTPGDDQAARTCLFNGAPTALALDVDGGLLAGWSSSICRLTAEGVSWAVAGSRVGGFSGDGGPATSASFAGVSGMVVDRTGAIFVADMWNYRVRKLTPVVQ